MVGNQLRINPTGLPGTAAEITSVITRAQKGDESALPALRKLLVPAGASDILGGNLADRAVQLLLAGLTGENLCFRESVSRKMDERRSDLAGPNPTTVERLLAE